MMRRFIIPLHFKNSTADFLIGGGSMAVCVPVDMA
jgi:hypothetical protein